MKCENLIHCLVFNQTLKFLFLIVLQFTLWGEASKCKQSCYTRGWHDRLIDDSARDATGDTRILSYKRHTAVTSYFKSKQLLHVGGPTTCLFTDVGSKTTKTCTLICRCQCLTVSKWIQLLCLWKIGLHHLHNYASECLHSFFCLAIKIFNSYYLYGRNRLGKFTNIFFQYAFQHFVFENNFGHILK